MKIRIRTGHIEIDYEGDEGFLKNDLGELLTLLGTARAPITDKGFSKGAELQAPSLAEAEGRFEGSINTIAAKLDVKSRPDLTMASMAHYTFLQHVETVRQPPTAPL